VTRRAWIILLLGAVLSASLGTFAFAARGETDAVEPSASWGAFTTAGWETVKKRVAHRGFTPASIRVVSATGGRQEGDVLALLAASRSSGSTCFIPVHGLTLKASVCHLAKPVTVFSARGHFTEVAPDGQRRSVATTEIVGLVRSTVTSIAVGRTTLGRPNTQGQPLLEAPGAFVFGGGFRGASVTLVARDASGHVVTRLELPGSQH
jgi:hypothetical protein